VAVNSNVVGDEVIVDVMNDGERRQTYGGHIISTDSASYRQTCSGPDHHGVWYKSTAGQLSKY